MTSLLMSSLPIDSTPYQLFRYSNSRDVVASSLSFSRPVARVPWCPCSQATFWTGCLSGNDALNIDGVSIGNVCFFFFNAKWNAMNKGHEKWSNLEQGNYMISHPCRGPQMTLNFWESGYPCSRCQRVCLSTLPTNACLHENINVHFYCLANHDCIYQFLEDWPLLQKETKVNNLWILELLAACVSSLRFLS